MGKIQHILLTLLLVLYMPATALGQASNIVRGTVIDGDNEPIIGATVHEIDGTNRVHSMTSTDINGEFSLQVKNPANKLKFSYVGFTPQVLPIEPVMNVSLQDASTLQEVVVTAQRTMNDGTMPIPIREISGAVQSINTKAFEGVSVQSVDDALQGRLDLDKLSAMDYERAFEYLTGFYGIGAKIANCVCLFGLHHIDAFPVDTWISQILMEHYYPKNPKKYRALPKSRLYEALIRDYFGGYQGYAGVMQQYIFYYERKEAGNGAGRRTYK